MKVKSRPRVPDRRRAAQADARSAPRRPRIRKPEKSVSLAVSRMPKWLISAWSTGDEGDHDDDLRRACPSMPKAAPKVPMKKNAGADVDGAEHGDQAEQVQPGGQPAGEAVAEDRAPVIEPARRRDRPRRSAPSPARRQPETAQPTIQPMPTPAPPIAEVAWAKRVDAARQDADDRERDREVREAAHRALQFLGVAHAVQDLQVLRPVGVRCSGRSWFLLPVLRSSPSLRLGVRVRQRRRRAANARAAGRRLHRWNRRLHMRASSQSRNFGDFGNRDLSRRGRIRAAARIVQGFRRSAVRPRKW